MSRKLSPIEYGNWLIDKVVCTNLVIIARVSGDLTEPVLRQALDYVQAKYPSLRWRIKDGEVPEFVSEGVPKIPLRIVQRQYEQHWIEEAEREIYEQCPYFKGPLVRMVQVISKDKKSCDLVMGCCHAATDGISIIMVVKELLSTAAKLSQGETIPPPTPLPEPLPSTELLKKDLEFEPYPLDEAGIKALKSEILKGDRDVPPDKRITHIIHRVLEEGETQKLVASCKKENTSVHTALCAAFFQAVVEQIRAQQKPARKGPLVISCLTPVDIRHHFIKPVEEDIGYYISFAMHYQRIDENAPIWPAAMEIKDAILTEINAGKDIEAILSVGEFWKKYPTPVEMVRGINQSYPPPW
ncbi:condensation domain-containing protein [Acidobacteriota bacterium]